MSDSLPIIHREHIHDMAEFEKFGCNPPRMSPDTPDRLQPDIFFEREFEKIDLIMPDGQEVDMWVFMDPEGLPTFPSTPIRVTQGQIVHTRIKAHTGPHTIHHHGIEPTAMNDGVGHMSFEADSEYTYQWYASEAGTYFYHCHRNTVLHFEFGLYGLLIIDPPADPSDPPGTKRAFAGGPKYDVEAFWVTDDIDPHWHHMSHGEGMDCPFGEDAGLNNFRPKYFLVTGVPSPRRPANPNGIITNPKVAINAKVGQTVLIRVIAAGYGTQTYKIDGLDAEVIAMDGRPMGVAPFNRYSRPFVVPAGNKFELTTARRYDLIVKPTQPGTFPVTFEYKHWITDAVMHTAQTLITVT